MANPKKVSKKSVKNPKQTKNEGTKVAPPVVVGVGGDYFSKDVLLSGSAIKKTTPLLPDGQKSSEQRTPSLPSSLNNEIPAKAVSAIDDSAVVQKYNDEDIVWDRRLPGVYNNSSQIGNDMPIGDLWQGSNSLMNPFALIRFHHVAGGEQHRKLVDHHGNFDFRSGMKIVPNLNISSLEHETQTIEANESDVVGNEFKKSIVSDGDVKIKLKNSHNYNSFDNQNQSLAPEDDNLYADKAGDVYRIVEDKTVEIWRCSNPKMLVGTGESSSDIEVNITSANTPRPTSFDYWAERTGLTKCDKVVKNKANKPDVAGLKIAGQWTTNEYCKDSINVGQEKVDEVKKQLEEAEKSIKKKIDAGWVFKGYKREKVYLNTAPTSTADKTIELLPNFENLCNVKNWKGDEQFLYDWSDFLYCSDYLNIPNNRLITLRRFPTPVYDSGRIPEQDNKKEFMTPIAKAVTWIGAGDSNKLADIFSMDWGFKWKTLESQVNTIEGNETDDGVGSSMEGGPLGKINNALLMGQNFASGGATERNRADTELTGNLDPYNGGPLANQPQGPVNSIQTTYQRDIGLNFNQDISLKFYYSLNSIGGINPKAALLDILANFLSLTYSNAGFWGGANRYFPNHPSVGKTLGYSKKTKDAYLSGDFTQFVSSIGDDLLAGLSGIADKLKSIFSGGNPAQILSNLGQTLGDSWLSKKSASSRPKMLSIRALLTGEPVGEWHLMVGNPFNPMLMIGNLILDSANLKIEDEMLGVDDFPTKWVFEVKLKHGKPRDKGDIESMFNRGYGRLYYAHSTTKNEPWNTSSSTKASKIDRPGGQKGNAGVKTDLSNMSTNSNYNQTANAVKVAERSSQAEDIYVGSRSKKESSRLKSEKSGEYYSNEYYKNLARNKYQTLVGVGKAFKVAAGAGFKNKGEFERKTKDA